MAKIVYKGGGGKRKERKEKEEMGKQGAKSAGSIHRGRKKVGKKKAKMVGKAIAEKKAAQAAHEKSVKEGTYVRPSSLKAGSKEKAAAITKIPKVRKVKN